MSSRDLTEGTSLQQFIVGIKKTSAESALVLSIDQVISAPNVFVFGEYLNLENVQKLQGTPSQKHLDLLKIFAYGTYGDYKANKDLPPLKDPQIKKLKQLTIASLAVKSRVIQYSVLQKELDIAQVRDLEDLIIDSIYIGVIQGQLDQKKNQLEVDVAMGRDLKPDSMTNMVNVLTQWHNQSELLLSNIKDRIQEASFLAEQEEKRKEEQKKRIDQVRINIKQALESEMNMSDFEDVGFFRGMGKKPGKKFKK